MAKNSEQKQIEIVIKGTQANSTLREIQSASRVLNAELKKLPVNSKEFADKAKQLKEVNNRLKSIGDDVKNAGKAFQDAAPSVGGWANTLKGVLGAGLIEKGIGALKDFAGSSVDSFLEAEKNAKKLEFALTNIAGEGQGSLNRLIKQSEELQNVGIFADDDIQAAQTALVQYGLTSKQVEKLIPQILDLAAAQGIELSAATDKVISAIGGQTKGLKDAGIAFEDTGSKTQNLALLTEKLTKFQGSNAAALEYTEGKVKRLENAWDNIKETVGEFLVNYGNDLLDFWDTLTGKISTAELQSRQINSALNKSFSESSKQKLEEAAKSEARRVELIKESEAKILAMKKQQSTLQGELAMRVGIQIMKNETALLQELKKLGNEKKKIDDDATIKGQQAAENANKKLYDAKKDLQEKIAQLEIEYYQRGLTSDAKELDDVHRKYAKLLKEAEKFEEEKLQIQKLYEKEIMAVQQKQAEEQQKKALETAKKREDVEDKIYLETLSAKDKEIAVEAQKWDALILEAEKYGIDATALRVAQGNAIAAIIDKQNKEELDKEKAKNEKELQLKKEKQERAIALTQEFASRVDGIMSSMATINRNRDEEEMRQYDKDLEIKERENSNLLRAKLIDQKEYDRRMLKAQQERDAKERKLKKEAFEREQNAAIAKAIINGAIGITQIWANYAAYPYVAAALSVVEAAAVALEIAAITSAPQPYAKGGYNRTSSDPQGYVANATLFTNSASGKPFIAGEAGAEWISPSWMLSDPQTANIIQSLENYRQTKTFASGGYSSSATKPMEYSKPTKSANMGGISEATAINLTNAINRMCNEGVAAYLDYDRYTRTLDKIDNARDAAKVG